MTHGRRAAALAMTAGAVVTVVGSLLTWVRSGGARRNSYDIFRLVGRLGFAPDGPAATALRWWPVMPLLATVAVVAVWWTWPRVGGIVGLMAGLYAGAVAIAVLAAPARGVVDSGAGPAVSAAGAVILIAGSIGVLTSTGDDARAPREARPGGPS